MVFLSLVSPVDSCEDLLDIIRKQIKLGRLEVLSYLDGLGNPTREIKCLVRMFQEEFKVYIVFIWLCDEESAI